MTDSASGLRRRFGAVWPWLGIAARLVVGIVWIIAGYAKLSDPSASVRAVRAFQILPEAVVPTVGYGLPILEICIGLLLVLGLTQRFAGVASSLMQLAFIIGIAAAWSRGLPIDCGCFGGGGATGQSFTQVRNGFIVDLLRDTGLLILSVAIAVWPRTRLALDTVVFPPLPDADLDLASDDDQDDDDPDVGRDVELERKPGR
ncbi:MAG: DoxX family protein [Nocardioidaceae bacterium]